MCDNFQKKYKNSVFQILKAYNNFDFSSAIKKKMH